MATFAFYVTVIHKSIKQRVIADKYQRKTSLRTFNLDFLVLAGILSAIGIVGVYAGYELHPAFYSQAAIIFGGIAYMALKTYYLDDREKAASISSEGLRSR